jgi:1-acyl-sn-glycerol-3-phosphate acyltransferase
MSETYSLKVPRRVLVRAVMKIGARLLMGGLSRTLVTGRENLPAKGPLILVGNHVAMIEVVLMMLHVPYQVEIIGVGDVPLDGRFAPLIKGYGFIPINRGSMDRKGMTMALDVLAQGGVVGIFPEGGIWEGGGQARAGVAWLSSKANAPVVPIGFGGMAGAIGAMATLKRPRLVMNIGAPLPPVREDAPGKSRKQALADGANAIMAQVEALIPAEEKARHRAIADEHFSLDIQITTLDGSAQILPPEFAVEHPHALAKLFHRPVVFNTLARNLKLPIDALLRIDQEHDPRAIVQAASAALTYLDANPQFLNYRFGADEGTAMTAALRSLAEVAQWAADHSAQMHVRPIRRYRYVDDPTEIVENSARAHEI